MLYIYQWIRNGGWGEFEPPSPQYSNQGEIIRVLSYRLGQQTESFLWVNLKHQQLCMSVQSLFQSHYQSSLSIFVFLPTYPVNNNIVATYLHVLVTNTLLNQ